jgi:hypothetical protein
MIGKFLSLGCSHTFGTGLDPGHIYVDEISRQLGLVNDNLSQPGGNASECLNRLVMALSKNSGYDFVIIQWPNMLRRTFYNQDSKIFENINSASAIFFNLLKASEKNFIEPWIDSILIADLLCKKAEIPLYHIHLETLDNEIIDRLLDHVVTIHDDRKLPDQTWLFDNQAKDGLHHSPACHKQWASRLIRIINENTT